MNRVCNSICLSVVALAFGLVVGCGGGGGGDGKNADGSKDQGKPSGSSNSGQKTAGGNEQSGPPKSFHQFGNLVIKSLLNKDRDAIKAVLVSKADRDSINELLKGTGIEITDKDFDLQEKVLSARFDEFEKAIEKHVKSRDKVKVLSNLAHIDNSFKPVGAKGYVEAKSIFSAGDDRQFALEFGDLALLKNGKWYVPDAFQALQIKNGDKVEVIELSKGKTESTLQKAKELATLKRLQKNFQPVEGVVTLDGKPLAGARVTMRKIRQYGKPGLARRPGGTTDKEGRFKIEYPYDLKYKLSGASEGQYQLTIQKYVPISSTEDSSSDDEKAADKKDAGKKDDKKDAKKSDEKDAANKAKDTISSSAKEYMARAEKVMAKMGDGSTTQMIEPLKSALPEGYTGRHTPFKITVKKGKNEIKLDLKSDFKAKPSRR